MFSKNIDRMRIRKVGDFSTATLETRLQKKNASKSPNENDFQPKILYPAKQ